MVNAIKASLSSSTGRWESDTSPHIQTKDIQLSYYVIIQCFYITQQISFFNQISDIWLSDCICSPSGINNHYLKALQLNPMVLCTCCTLIPNIWMCACWWQLLSHCINNPPVLPMRCWQRQGALHNPHSTRTAQKDSVGTFKGTDVNESKVCTCARIFQASVFLHYLDTDRQTFRRTSPTCLYSHEPERKSFFRQVWPTQSVALRCQVWRTSTQPFLSLFVKFWIYHKSLMVMQRPSILL